MFLVKRWCWKRELVWVIVLQALRKSWRRLIFIGKGTSIVSFKKEKDEKMSLNLLFNVDDISISEIRHAQWFECLSLDYSGKHELWPWVMWNIYDWYLLFHCGAALRGKCTNNSVWHYLEQNFTGLQWNGRKFFRFLSESLDYESISYGLRYMGHLWLVSAVSWWRTVEVPTCDTGFLHEK